MKLTEDALPSKATRSLIYTVVLAIALTAIYTVWFFVINKQPLSSESNIWGSFGDFVGGVMNPIVALVALYWLTQSISIQKQELHDTRTVLEDQAKSDEIKRFEQTFFSLLNEHNSLLNLLKNVPDDRLGVLEVRSYVFGRSANIEEAKRYLSEKDLVIGHYFRLLYQIMKFIALRCPGTACEYWELKSSKPQSQPSAEEKFYSNILRSALDARTSQLLAINCYSPSQDHSYYAYRRLVERYAFLEHMPFKTPGKNPSPVLIDAYNAFEKSAFGDSDYVKELHLLDYVS